ncbi:hypothetical protein DEU56DRAFT_841629 [Suillus clintonianus]|uniref:uncharacterized protein n=1 Tax=Suillus clintonianus TaxID=1904413 RepID=UPI001B87AAC8|nr:uncharacterized protein DEU56DRAFT_841629 [Suillus clintonianus]KAG2114858.1 hypothetical protein DEU56DRAFT_841629 [Suillus clintonianus]
MRSPAARRHLAVPMVAVIVWQAILSAWLSHVIQRLDSGIRLHRRRHKINDSLHVAIHIILGCNIGATVSGATISRNNRGAAFLSRRSLSFGKQVLLTSCVRNFESRI